MASIVRPASAPVSSGPLQDIECSFEVVGDGGEVDLDGGFVDAAPSHPAQAVASFPCAEYLLNPPPHPVDGLIPVFELAKRLLCDGDLFDQRGVSISADMCFEAMNGGLPPYV
jgi:hypothetical protein